MNIHLIRPNLRPDVSNIRRIVCLVCLLGVALSAAFLPHVAADDLSWVFTHLE